MDATAISLCKDNQLPIIVYNLQPDRQPAPHRHAARRVGTIVKEYVMNDQGDWSPTPSSAWTPRWRRCAASSSAMRTGRASLSMLDNMRVDYYGTPTPLNQVGNLCTPDPTHDHHPALGRDAAAGASRRPSARRTST